VFLFHHIYFSPRELNRASYSRLHEPKVKSKHVTLKLSISYILLYIICSCSSRCISNNLYKSLSVNNTHFLFVYLFSIILGYSFRSHGPSSGLQHYHNTDPNYSIVTIEISKALHGKLCFSVKTQTKSRLSP
jgi:hypothetical protein